MRFKLSHKFILKYERLCERARAWSKSADNAINYESLHPLTYSLGVLLKKLPTCNTHKQVAVCELKKSVFSPLNITPALAYLFFPQYSNKLTQMRCALNIFMLI